MKIKRVIRPLNKPLDIYDTAREELARCYWWSGQTRAAGQYGSI